MLGIKTGIPVWTRTLNGACTRCDADVSSSDVETHLSNAAAHAPMPWLELSLIVAAGAAAEVETALEDLGALSVTLLDAEGPPDPRARTRRNAAVGADRDVGVVRCRTATAPASSTR